MNRRTVYLQGWEYELFSARLLANPQLRAVRHTHFSTLVTDPNAA